MTTLLSPSLAFPFGVLVLLKLSLGSHSSSPGVLLEPVLLCVIISSFGIHTEWFKHRWSWSCVSVARRRHFGCHHLDVQSVLVIVVPL